MESALDNLSISDESFKIYKKQRVVSDNLGKNNTSNHEKIYAHIERNIRKTKKCTFGHALGSKTGVKHEGPQDLPIINFPLKGCSINENGEVSIKGGDGLQGFCKMCDTRRRRKRLEMSREENKGGYDTYEKKYGKTTRICSVCKEDKDVMECFNLSPGMECGIHNVCKKCSKQYGESIGDRFIKYRPDGNFKYEKTKENQHDDHIMPLSYGGSNEKINHRLITSQENLSKSNTIPFENIMEINPLLLSSRWRHILLTSQQENFSMVVFKSRISSAILEEQKKIFSMTDEEIKDVFEHYNKSNNKRYNVKRAVEKFKTYCRELLKL